MLRRIFPFLDWFRLCTRKNLRSDLVAGLTVALVLIPQSMAYAQLAGLPSYYGLYAAFLPPMVAALFGSSRQLATGPVAVVSLMTAASLEPIAIAGSDTYIAYAVLLALIVGVFQLALGLLRLGVVVNFLSHPVVNGFTGAAAIIIATSQLSKIFGVYVDKAPYHFQTIGRVLLSAYHYTHWPTLLLALLSFGVMIGLRRVSPQIPSVLAAVLLTTVISFVSGFEHDYTTSLAHLESPEVKSLIGELNSDLLKMKALSRERSRYKKKAAAIESRHGESSIEALRVQLEVDVLDLRLEATENHAQIMREKLRAYLFEAVHHAHANTNVNAGPLRFYPTGELPPGARADGRRWRLRVGHTPLKDANLLMMGGGRVVGNIPRGLPKIEVPEIDILVLKALCQAAVIISLLGFMEAISIAKAMAVKTGQRLDANQELIGQGLANIAGAMGQSYPTSGSFSRSAVNFQAGGVTGLSSVITSAVVVVVLLFLTPLLYHLPEAVLAAVIMMAVFGLINVSGFIHAYRASRADGIICLLSFGATLAFAPHLDKGIFIGVALSIALYLYESMSPRITFLSRHVDGTFRSARYWKLARCKHIMVVRFYGKLFFANSAALETAIIKEITQMPDLRHIVIVGNGINALDSSGEEIISQLAQEIRRNGFGLSFTALREPVIEVLERTGALGKIGRENIYGNLHMALDSIGYKIHQSSDEHPCPLMTPTTIEPPARNSQKKGE